jgi:hypothetical protein
MLGSGRPFCIQVFSRIQFYNKILQSYIIQLINPRKTAFTRSNQRQKIMAEQNELINSAHKDISVINLCVIDPSHTDQINAGQEGRKALKPSS